MDQAPAAAPVGFVRRPQHERDAYIREEMARDAAKAEKRKALRVKYPFKPQ